MDDQAYSLLGGAVQFIPRITGGDLLTLVSVLSAVLFFAIQQRRAVKNQRHEIYQRLELASNDLFSFDAKHADVLEKFLDRMPQRDKFGKIFEHFDEIQAGADREAIDPTLRGEYEKLKRDMYITRKYYEKTINLFEMATHFRHDKIIERSVYASWVIWFFDICMQWAFRSMWPDLKKNYSKQLRAIFEYPLAHFDFEHDDVVNLEKKFFEHVGSLMSCKEIIKWLEDVRNEEETLPRYPEHCPRFLALNCRHMIRWRSQRA